MNEMTIILLIFLGICEILIILYSIWYVISPMPTLGKAKWTMLEAMPKDIHGNIVDLGSGWGSLIIPLAKKFPHCSIIGYEISPIPWAFSFLLTKILRLKNVKVYRKDFFSVKLHDFSLVVCYLYPDAMKQLKNKLESELTPGSWVVSNTFSVPGWTPEKVLDSGDLYHNKIYVYRIKKN